MQIEVNSKVNICKDVAYGWFLFKYKIKIVLTVPPNGPHFEVFITDPFTLKLYKYIDVH